MRILPRNRIKYLTNRILNSYPEAKIFLNQETGTLAFVLSFPNSSGPPMSCLIIAGAEWEPYGGPQPWDKKKEDLMNNSLKDIHYRTELFNLVKIDQSWI